MSTYFSGVGKFVVRARSLLMLVVWIVVIVLGAYILFAGLLFVFQSSLIYYPESNIWADPGSIGLEFENVWFQTEDSVKLNGWLIPKQNHRGVILFCHGNAGNISHRLESIQVFHRLGLGVFIFDYRGYGRSDGKPNEQGTYEDAEAAWQYLVEQRKVNASEIIIFGRSLGGVVAAWLTEMNTPAALIIESTFTSLSDVAATLYPYLPVRLLLRFKYNTVECLTNVNCPIMIIHSRDDEIMPFKHGQHLYEVVNEPKVFFEISGTHNEGFITSGEHYEAGLDSFISEYVKTTN